MRVNAIITFEFLLQCKIFYTNLIAHATIKSAKRLYLFYGRSEHAKTCGLIPLPGSAKLHTGSGMTKVDFYYAQMTSGVWGQ